MPTSGPGFSSTGRPPNTGTSTLEHAIYATDAILDYPQSGERFRGRSSIQAQRGGHPAVLTIRRILGAGDFWVSSA